MIKLYNVELMLVCKEHNMFHWMDMILCHTEYLTKDNFLLLINSWDDKINAVYATLQNLLQQIHDGPY